MVTELMTVQFEARHRELVARAERAHLIAEAAAAPPKRSVLATLRRAVGSALVRAGERIRGASRPTPAGSAVTEATLRAAR